MSATIPTLSRGDSPEAKSAALQQAGCMVIRDVANKSQRDSLVAELQEHMDNAKVRLDDDPLEFYPGHTQRVSGLVSRSETVRDDAARSNINVRSLPAVTVNSATSYERRPQHRPRRSRSGVAQRIPSPTSQSRPTILATMWAISDFREDNGATLVVPGSHTWSADRSPEPDEITSAEMPAGSLFFWLGGTLHGGGANTSSDWRYGLILTY